MVKLGVHYTPEYIADFVLSKVMRFVRNDSPRILEPCVGEGVFINSISKIVGNSFAPVVDAVEINKDTCSAVRKRFTTIELSRVNNVDFLRYSTNKKYDLIVGNPPYVNTRYMTDEQKNICSKMADEWSCVDVKVRIKNLWTAFIAKSEELLSENGVIAFVLPLDLAHVSHADSVKECLKRKFKRIELYEFDGVVFDDADQHAVLMIATKNDCGYSDGVYHTRVSIEGGDLNADEPVALNGVLGNKWTDHGLSSYEVSFLKDMANSMTRIGEYCTTSPGVVTAANDYFILTHEEICRNGLKKYATPVIENAKNVNGSVSFDVADWERLRDEQQPCYILDFSKGDKLTKKAEKYINEGESLGISGRYKCKNRKKWYVVPSIGSGEAFFLRRCHLYPKLVMNRANICVTDTAYILKMYDGYEAESLVYSYYNSLTLAFSEVLGRSYAGGVLELTPNEFRTIPIVFKQADDKLFNQFGSTFSGKSTIIDVLKVNDDILLGETLGLTKKDMKLAKSIYSKLHKLRLKYS